jgi:tetratricopeptide (TPR) repeat protein
MTNDTDEDTTIGANESASFSDLKQRIQQIETQISGAETALFERVSRYAGLIALVLSLLIGGLELYDRTIRTAEEEQQDNRDRIASISKSLDLLRSEQAFLGNNPMAPQAIIRQPQINGERYRLLEQLERLSDEGFDEMSSVELTVLGSEYMSVQQYPQAIRFLRQAVVTASDNQVAHEAKRYLAMSLFPPSDVQDVQSARNMMGELEDGLCQPMSAANMAQIGILKEGWVIGEALARHCNASAAQLAELIDHWSIMHSMPAFAQGGSNNVAIPDPDQIRAAYQTRTGCVMN